MSARTIAALLLAMSAGASAQQPRHERKIVCACIAPSCDFDKPVGGGYLFEPEKLDGDPPDVSRLPEGSRQGIVILNVRIDEHGRVTDACVLRGMSTTIDTKAIAAVLTWRYEPAALARPQNGKPVGTQVPIALTVTVQIK